MASTPQWKVYRGKEYIGCCKYAEDAAALVSLGGDDCTVKHGHSLVVWREGQEEFSAGESYDRAAEVMETRRRKHFEGVYIRMHGKLPDGYTSV